MNVLDAAYLTVHDYPGGAEALAVRLGKRGTSLSHEVSPNRPDAKLGLQDAQAIMTMTGDLRILHAQAAELDCLLLPMPRLEGGGEGLAGQTAQLAREFAELMAELVADAADGHITDNELGRIQQAWGELVAAGHSMVGHVQAMNARTRLRKAA
jgi:hypothetical protein